MTSRNPGAEVETSDLYYAAYLRAAGVEMKRTERLATNNGRITFVFDGSVSNVEELKTAWFNDTGKVPAKSYAHHIKDLKSLCHNR